MTLAVAKFTPEAMLQATRRSAAVPNASGTRALYSTSTYSFEEHRKHVQIRVLDLGTGQSRPVVEDQNSLEPVWISDDDFVYFQSVGKGQTALVLGHAGRPPSGEEDKDKDKDKEKPELKQTIATFDGNLSSLKVTRLRNGTLGFACAALATPSGQLANPETETPAASSARVYTALYARHWDAWTGPNRNALWYGALRRRPVDETGGCGCGWALATPTLTNALRGTALSSPVAPFGGTGDFDVGPTGLVFVARDPALDPALHTKTDLYYVALATFAEASPPAPPVRVATPPALEGYTNAPVFAHDGRRVVCTRMRSRCYEADKPRLLLVRDIAAGAEGGRDNVVEFFATEDGAGGWDARPEGPIVWSADDETLYVTAEVEARARIFRLPSDPAKAKPEAAARGGGGGGGGGGGPVRLDSGEGSVADVRLLGGRSSSAGDRLLVTSSSLIDNSCYSVVDTDKPSVEVISSNSKRGRAFGLSRAQVADFWFPRGRGGDDDDDDDDGAMCHALVVRPSDFDAGRRYPLALLIHGGPQGAWLDGWSTRWNPAVFAEQGYVVVCPNPTGSTGYGQARVDAIRGQWGGRPYEDLASCLAHVGSTMPYVDVGRAVALGASYGGYMINWIQGHPLGRKFKALVCHDGSFSTLSQWSTEELFFPIHDFGGTLWDNRAGYEKWDPARFVGAWQTPQLIIHGELDYRLPITEGLAPFNVLQARGVPSKLVVFPDENHWVLKHENSLVWHREVLDWINRYTSPEGSKQGKDAGEEVGAGRLCVDHPPSEFEAC